jgi:hypothetical protein
VSNNSRTSLPVLKHDLGLVWQKIWRISCVSSLLRRLFVTQADVPGLPGPGHGRHVCYAHAQHTAQPPISFQRLAIIKETVSQDFSKSFILLLRRLLISMTEQFINLYIFSKDLMGYNLGSPAVEGLWIFFIVLLNWLKPFSPHQPI